MSTTSLMEAGPQRRNFNVSIRGRLAMAGFGATTLALVGASIVWGQFDRPGKVSSCDPTEKPVPRYYPSPDAVSWNGENKIGRLADAIDEIDEVMEPGVMVFQEGSVDDIESLCERKSDKFVTSILTDATRNRNGGGQAILLVTSYKPQNIRKRVFNGPSFFGVASDVFEGFTKDLVATAQASPTVKNIKEAVKESRVTVAFTMKAWVGGELRDVRYITGHVTPLEVDRKKQIDDNVEFIREDMESELPTVVCMDWNGSPKEINDRLSKIGLITLKTTQTSIHGRTIDFCSYSKAGFEKVGSVYAKVIKKGGSDHFPLSIAFSDKRLD